MINMRVRSVGHARLRVTMNSKFRQGLFARSAVAVSRLRLHLRNGKREFWSRVATSAAMVQDALVGR